MTAVEIARKLARLGQEEDARNAYTVALHVDKTEVSERMEAACYILQTGGDIRISITAFLSLYREGYFQDDIFHLLTRLFYQPSEQSRRERYKENLKVLKTYPYLFRKDFPAFEDLPLQFLPYDDKGGYIPFSFSERRFSEFVKVNDTVITRHFFKDLEKPVLAADVYSQYELQYLFDNVRPSEYIGRENHIYLHYSDWETFCAWLQVLDFRKLLNRKKIVFLIEDEIAQYPIDFKARFGVDYGKYSLKPVKIEEVTRLIWHTQLSSSNGGDFFNEVFDYHPNLYFYPSIMFDKLVALIGEYKTFLSSCSNLKEAISGLKKWKNAHLIENLYRIKHPTDKDILVACYMQEMETYGNVDKASRIVPALFFQPHFAHLDSYLHVDEETGVTILETSIEEEIHQSGIFNEFPYIKTFTPVRRFTTSYGSTLRFMDKNIDELREKNDPKAGVTVISDLVTDRILNRTFMRDPEDRLYRDSVVVRFEDGKLNPAATFSKLAEFLDLPYTKSMTYCSQDGEHDVQTAEGNAIGFDPVTVYKTYDDYCGNAERCYIEYFLRDAYQFYGYDFQYYDGGPVDENKLKDWIDHFDIQNQKIRDTWGLLIRKQSLKQIPSNQDENELKDLLLDAYMERTRENRLFIARNLQRTLQFVNKRGQPLEMTPMLQPDPALLVQPLYH